MTSTTVQPLASPLTWPAGRPRTPRAQRRRNNLWKGAGVSTACVDIEREVRLMGGDELVVSTNLALRIDGFPRSGQPEPEDGGACVYFDRKGRRIALACDRWVLVRENLRAIAMHLAAIRGQERWGVGDLDAAFAGYAALPEPAAEKPWWEVLGFERSVASALHRLHVDVRENELRRKFRDRAKELHPDAGGTHEAFVGLQRAFAAGCAELGVIP